jgi:hypothetical protein
VKKDEIYQFVVIGLICRKIPNCIVNFLYFMSVNAEITDFFEGAFVVPCAYLGNNFAKNELFPKKMAGLSCHLFISFKIKAQTLH